MTYPTLVDELSVVDILVEVAALVVEEVASDSKVAEGSYNEESDVELSFVDISFVEDFVAADSGVIFCVLSSEKVLVSMVDVCRVVDCISAELKVEATDPELCSDANIIAEEYTGLDAVELNVPTEETLLPSTAIVVSAGSDAEEEVGLATFEAALITETMELVTNLEIDPLERVLEAADVAYVITFPVLETTT